MLTIVIPSNETACGVVALRDHGQRGDLSKAFGAPKN